MHWLRLRIPTSESLSEIQALSACRRHGARASHSDLRPHRGSNSDGAMEEWEDKIRFDACRLSAFDTLTDTNKDTSTRINETEPCSRGQKKGSKSRKSKNVSSESENQGSQEPCKTELYDSSRTVHCRHPSDSDDTEPARASKQVRSRTDFPPFYPNLTAGRFQNTRQAVKSNKSTGSLSQQAKQAAKRLAREAAEKEKQVC